MVIHLRLTQLPLDLLDSESLFALELVYLAKSFNCFRAVEETVPSRGLAHGVENAFLYVEPDLGRKDACLFCQLTSLDEHLVTSG